MDVKKINGYDIKDETARNSIILINQTLSKKIHIFDNVQQLKQANNLNSGEYVKTKGFYNANDGGGAEYQIVSNDETLENGLVLELQNDLRAKMIIEKNTVDIRKMGAITTEDCAEIIQTLINSNYCVYVPKGTWISDPITCKSGTKIVGENTNYQVITNDVNMNDNISILQCNSDCETFIDCSNADHVEISICLSSCRNKGEYANAKNIGQFIKLDHTCYSTFDLMILCINNNAISIKNSWENTFKRTYFRGILTPNAVNIKCKEGQQGISQNVFYDIQSEGFGATILDCSEHCLLYHNKFYSILAELTQYSPFEKVTDTATEQIPLFKIASGGNNVIESIQLNNYSAKNGSFDSTVYEHCIFEVNNENGYTFGFKIGDIIFDTGVARAIQIINQIGNSGLDTSYLIIDNIISPMGYVTRFNMEGMSYFKIGHIYTKNLKTSPRLNTDYSITEWYSPEDSGETPIISNNTDYNALNNENAVVKISENLKKVAALRVKKDDVLKIYYKSDEEISYEIKLLQRNNSVADTITGTLSAKSTYQIVDLETISNSGMFIAAISLSSNGNSYIADVFI